MDDTIRPRILIQLDTDAKASVFDAVVAIDSGVEHLLQYSNVDENNVVELIYGAMFTRGPSQLVSTAVFIGGSDVAKGERIAARIASTFFGPIRVSVMLDSNGANTTAVAAVLSAARHVDLAQSECLVLGGTGPVGGRVARLLLMQGCRVHLASRSKQRAEDSCNAILERLGNATGDRTLRLSPLGMDDQHSLDQVLTRANMMIACGAAGICLISQDAIDTAGQLKVAIDLNAVPPAGIEGIASTDKAVSRGQRVDYGAIGVGGTKMKIHRAAIQALFKRNDLALDAPEIFQLGSQMG